MKVKDLKILLENHSDDEDVIMSTDSEGNGYAPLADASIQTYEPQDGYVDGIYEPELTKEMEKEGYTEEDVRKPGENGYVRCIVLWPTH